MYIQTPRENLSNKIFDGVQLNAPSNSISQLINYQSSYQLSYHQLPAIG